MSQFNKLYYHYYKRERKRKSPSPKAGLILAPVVCQAAGWENLHRLSEKLAPLGVMGDNSGPLLKP